MEAIQDRTPNPAMGISTRSRIHLSRTRSGRPRPSDPSDQLLTSLLIKNLRVKRVFSQTANPPVFSADSKSQPAPPLTSLPEAAKPFESDFKIDSETKATVVKTRKRVFKAPGSFSFRRMLPYLKDINKENSCVLEICEVPNQFTARNNSIECRSFNSDSPMGTLRVPSLVPGNGDRLPPVVAANQCLPDPAVDGQNGNIDLGVGSEEQKLNVSEAPLPMEDCEVNVDGVTDMSTDGNISVENIITDVQVDFVSSSKDQDVKDVNVNEEYSCKDNEVVQHKESSNQAQCEGPKSIEMEYPCDVRSPHHTNEQEVGNTEEVLNLKRDLHEESIQMTPPDAEIVGKLQVEVKVIGREENGHQSADQGLGKPRNGNDYNGFAQVELRRGSFPKRKTVLNPCSRLKLFKRPGSVSYRRLLPFLMDMEKGNSVSSRSEIPMTDMVQSQSSSPSQLGSPLEKSNVPLFHADSGTPAIQMTNANGSSSIDEPNIVSPDHITVSQIPCDLQKEVHGQQTASGKQSKLEASPNITESFREAAEPSVSILEKDGAKASRPELPVTSVFSHGAVGNITSLTPAISDDGKPDKANILGENPSKIDATSVTQAVADRKGILKRNPRGCRGLCTCLNCTSFRLHAERAFEFSRNQMQDAEEVSLHLMMELSKLRKLLENSAAGNDHAVTLNEVESACRKASEAEDLARNRIDEMNYDLNIHCRITCLHEPRVRFGNLTEGKVIPKPKCSSKKI